MKLDWFSVTVTVLFIAIIVALSISISHKVEEPFTELYFNDFKTLPKIINNEVSFSYTINNLEQQDFSYDVNITAEVFNGNFSKIINLKQESINVLKDNNYTGNEKFSLPGLFDKAKIQVTLNNKNQDIHFWSFYAKESFNYPEYGPVSLDCLNPVVNVDSNKLSLGLHGDYAEEWPLAKIYVNGVKIDEFLVDSNNIKYYNYDLTLNKGVNVLDIVFDNDKYIKNEDGTVLDRNLYVDEVLIGTNKLTGIVDKGSNFGAFDCQETSAGKGLYFNAAYRVKFYS